MYSSINQNLFDSDDGGKDDDAFIASLLALALVDRVLGFSI